jgi:hypothetical protein
LANETEPKPPGIKITAGSSELAPFIYTDGVATYGVSHGVVAIELAANAILPEGTGTRTDLYVVAHLRCSRAAATNLRDTLNKALAMSANDQQIQPIPHSKPH